MSDEPRTRTGKARAALAEAVADDFDEVRGHLRSAIEKAKHLTSESGGVNGVAVYWRGVASKLEHELGVLEVKLAETRKALTDRKAPPEVSATTDDEHMDRVRDAREGVA